MQNSTNFGKFEMETDVLRILLRINVKRSKQKYSELKVNSKIHEANKKMET